MCLSILASNFFENAGNENVMNRVVDFKEEDITKIRKIIEQNFGNLERLVINFEGFKELEITYQLKVTPSLRNNDDEEYDPETFPIEIKVM